MDTDFMDIKGEPKTGWVSLVQRLVRITLVTTDLKSEQADTTQEE